MEHLSKTSKNKLFDFGSGIVTFSSTILFMIHLLNIKNNVSKASGFDGNLQDYESSIIEAQEILKGVKALEEKEK